MSQRNLIRTGRLAWSLLGVLGVLVISGLLMRELALVVVPVVLALFPATLLIPVCRRLEKWRVPRLLAAFLTLLGGIVVFGGLGAGAITLVVSEVPDLVESAGEGIESAEAAIGRVVPGFEFPGRDRLVEMLQDAFVGEEGDGDGEGDGDAGGVEGAGGIATATLAFTAGLVEAISGLLLTLVILFFYLRNGRSLAEGMAGFVAPNQKDRILEMADSAWDTLGGYFRGQLLVALVDAVLIGLALLLLGVPLALPLAVIVFFGGLFPILGAVVTGFLAVLVALAHGGLGLGLAVAGVVLLVQQLEGNVLEPLILSRVIDLQPLTVILSLTLGAVVLGVLGAFLAVPAVAIAKQVITDLREESGSSRIVGAPGPAGD